MFQQTLTHTWPFSFPETITITDTTLHKLYPHLKPSIVLPAGEGAKTRETKAWIEDELFALGATKETQLVAVGGGVVLDLVGFVAATFCRGIPFYSVPTTLLAMIDASLGGKNGVNTPFGKNLIGSYWEPVATWIDLAFLTSLTEEQIRHGKMEMIKHGLIFSKEHLRKVTSEPLSEKLLLESREIKQTIIQQEQEEPGTRHLLNFGHTVAHALEALSNYTLPHGEAVRQGMLLESYLSLTKGFLSRKDFQQLVQLLGTNKQQVYPPEKLWECMLKDKKSLNGQPHFVALKALGEPKSERGSLVPFTLKEFTQAVHTFETELCNMS